MQSLPSTHTHIPRSRIITGGVVLLVLALLAVAGYVGVRYAIQNATETAQQLASNAAEQVRSALNITPRVSISGLTVIEQRSPIMELALVQQTLFKEYTWQHTFLGSTKMLVLRGEFVAKAGYNLQDSFALAITPATDSSALAVRVRLPAPRLLSLEMKQYSVARDEHGFWNYVTAQDREQAVNALQREARLSVEQSDILQSVHAEAHRRFQDALSKATRLTPQVDTSRLRVYYVVP
jgi:hypothetical protein